MTADDYTDLARLAEAATGGEWTVKHRESLDWLSQERGDETHQPGSSVHNGDPGNPLFGTVWPHRNGAANAEFIAAANPATILRLIEDYRQLWAHGQSAANFWKREYEALAARLAAVEALADEWEQFVATSLLAEDLRAVLSAAPTDTTKET